MSSRELRNHGGEVVDRVARGESVDRVARSESVTVTRAGRPVAELRAISAPALSAQTLLTRWRQLPSVDPRALRSDIDELLDAGV